MAALMPPVAFSVLNRIRERRPQVWFAPLLVACAVGAGLSLGAAALSTRSALLLGASFLLAAVGFLWTGASPVIAAGAFVLWAFIRRIYPADDVSSDPAALGPLIMALPLAYSGLQARLATVTKGYLAWLVICTPIGGISVGLAGAANAVVPLLAAAGLATRPHLQKRFLNTLCLAGGIAFLYGIVQFLSIPGWDLAWLEVSPLRFSSGTPGQSSFRPFATLASPGTGAFLAATLILFSVSAYARARCRLSLRLFTLAAGLPYLALTQVRSAWLALVIGLVVLLSLGGRAAARRGLVLVALIVAVAQVPVVQQSLAPRLQTLQNTSSDTSYNSRLSLLQELPTYLSPVGRGLGTASAGSRASEDHSLDNGYIVVLAETGLVGFALLAALFLAMLRGADREQYAFLAMLMVFNLAGFALGNLSGLLLFSLAGVPLHAGTAASEPEERASGQQLVLLSA